jgi:hypothetical protein
VQRALGVVTVIGLVVATAAAFAITERLKLVKSPITGTRVSKLISPTCGCARGEASISVKLRRGDRVTVAVLDVHRRVVRVLVTGKRVARGHHVFRWDGRTAVGRRAPDGHYQVEIHLEAQHRTIVLPNVIGLDTRPPQINLVTTNRPDNVFSPDRDGQADYIRFHFELSERARVGLYFRGRRIVGPTRRQAPIGNISWNGTVGGRRLASGTYTIDVGATDLAGNATPIGKRWPVRVRIRFIVLANHRIVGVRARARFEIGVSTDARRYRWHLGASNGGGQGPVLSLRAPARPGSYRLVVTEHGHSDRATVVVH